MKYKFFRLYNKTGVGEGVDNLAKIASRIKGKGVGKKRKQDKYKTVIVKCYGNMSVNNSANIILTHWVTLSIFI